MAPRSAISTRNGNDPGVSFYTHISDQYDLFASRLIATTAGEAPYVLEGWCLRDECAKLYYGPDAELPIADQANLWRGPSNLSAWKGCPWGTGRD